MRFSQIDKSAAVVALILCTAFTALASEQILPPSGCEADWINRSQFDATATVNQVENLEREAERGLLGAQLRLGLLKKTLDGRWTAPEDNSYNIIWLEKAVAQGSKSALWELNKYRVKQITNEAFLHSMIAAAEDEGNPWAASDLLFKTSGRLGKDHIPTSCYVPWTGGTECAPKELLPISSASKWAEIASEGGNAAAQEWLCLAASLGRPERGRPQDDQAALKWCGLAARNACAYGVITYYIKALIDNKIATGLTDPRVKRWYEMQGQPWRSPSAGFFSRPPN